MEIIVVIALISALISALIQFGLYKLTKKKFAMFFLPIICGITPIFLLIRYGNYSFFSKEAGYSLIAIIIGIPASIGGLLAGIIISIKNK